MKLTLHVARFARKFESAQRRVVTRYKQMNKISLEQSNLE